jgi:peptidoglycan hydrolase-like protein with peptidoglycan-binding domain
MTIRTLASRRRRLAATFVLAGTLAGGTSIATAAPAPVPAAPNAPGSAVGLQYGDRGPEVTALQEALVRVGVGVRHGVDGYFGSATRASVKAWQNHKGLAVTGVVDEATARSLNLPTGATVSTASGSVSASNSLAAGARGRAVAELQLALINRGFVPTGGVDGIFGAATRNAVTQFQQQNGLSATGQADAATLRALGLAAGASSNSPAAGTSTGQLARGSRGPAVADVQRALLSAGIRVAGGADGIFGPATEAALREFQRANGLTVDGRVGPQTAAALAAVGAGSGEAASPPRQSDGSAIVGLRLGARGPAVTALQRAIMELGWHVPGGADGIFGTATQSVVLLVQRTNGIAPSGEIDATTARALGLSGSAPTAAPAPSSPSSSGTTAAGFATYDERGARVVALQQALIRAGIAVRGGADGVFGTGTLAAVIAFQRARGLAATGKVDAPTAAALGLSPMNAPTPTVAPSSVRLQAKPVQGPCFYVDTWLAPRGAGRRHLGVDIGAAEGKELYAVVSGRISQIYVDRPGSLSGNGLKIAMPDGTYFFYAHLSRLAPGIQVGTPVTAGQVVGYVGKTGNTAVPHLHLEVHPGGGSAVNPYPIVKAIGAC